MKYRPFRWPADYDTVAGNNVQQFRVKVRSISTGGAMLNGMTGVILGDKVWMRLNMRKVNGTVRWAADQRCGVNFDMPLAEREVVQIRQTAKHGHAAPGFTQRRPKIGFAVRA